jgi:hypothetical protein
MDMYSIVLLVIAVACGLGALILLIKRKQEESRTSATTATNAPKKVEAQLVESRTIPKPPMHPHKVKKSVALRQRRRVNSKGFVAPTGYFWNELDELFDLEGWLIEGILLTQLLDNMERMSLEEIQNCNEEYAREIGATDVPAAEVEPVESPETVSVRATPPPPPAPEPVHHEPEPEPERTSWGASGGSDYDSGGSSFDSGGDCGSDD